MFLKKYISIIFLILFITLTTSAYGEGIYSYPQSFIDRIGFIRKNPVIPSGTILNVEGTAKTMISAEDIVYIVGTGHRPLRVGKKYFIYKTMEQKIKKEKYIGIQHYITGIVEIKDRKFDLYMGKITHAFRPISIDDKLMPYKKRLSEIQHRPSLKQLYGEIILSEEGEVMIGPETIAFIDKGYMDGVRPGQIYDLYDQDKTILNNKQTKILLPPIDFGSFLVLHTEENISTVIITNAGKSISPGTKFRSPEY